MVACVQQVQLQQRCLTRKARNQIQEVGKDRRRDIVVAAASHTTWRRWLWLILILLLDRQCVAVRASTAGPRTAARQAPARVQLCEALLGTLS